MSLNPNVKRISLIVVETTVGNGTDEEPFRRLFTLCGLDGKPLVSVDEYKPDRGIGRPCDVLLRIGRIQGDA